MDESWFYSFTSAPSRDKDKASTHKRRASLLQQPAENKIDAVTIDTIQEAAEEEHVHIGPPQATLARRAQSYSDFYDVVRAYVKKEAQVRSRDDGYDQSPTSNESSADLRFEDEFALLEEQLLAESHEEYQEYSEQLQLANSHLDGLLSATTDTLDILTTLSLSFRTVQSQTDAFRLQCESIIEEQKRLVMLAGGIDENMRYYTYLEPITRRLNAPGASNLVKGKDFPEMLHSLDNCLTYMETHPNQVEAGTYRSRYRLLLTRGLTLIRHYFTKSLGDIAADISRRIQGGQLKESTHSAMLYAKFRVSAPELKALGIEIQKRAVPTPDDVDAGREPEYASLMRELYQSYTTTRGRLMLPLVSRKMAELHGSTSQNDVFAFSQASISFMRGICLDEYDLWFEWFERDGELDSFLESLMEPMFDYLRPRVIHEVKLEKLCELCATIQGRYMDSESEDEDDAGNSLASPTSNGRPLGRRLDFASLIQPALEDAQTRLVFLALGVLRDQIENYKPKAEDLEWPKPNGSTNGTRTGPVLSGTRTTASTTPITLNDKTTANDTPNDDGESVFSTRLTAEEHNASKQQWYPTLRKAMWLLRRIYRLVNSTVFDDLAHRIVHSTIHSLILARSRVANKKTPQDGYLFLIVHLLQLKQQIVAFDIEFVPPEVEFDFSSVTNTFYELRDRGSLWNPASWVRLVSGAVVGGGLLPKVVENMLDAKAELDGRLRTVINDFVNSYAEHICGPIDAKTVAKATNSSGKATMKKGAAGKQPEIGSFDALKAVRTVRGLAEKDVPALRTKLNEFVADVRTRETLVAAVRDQVVMTYEEFFDAQSEGTGRKLSRKGKGREDEIWGANLFGEAMEKVFQVGMLGDDRDENYGGDDGDSGRGGNVSD